MFHVATLARCVFAQDNTDVGLSDVNNGYLAELVAAFNNMMTNEKFADICTAAPKGTQLVARRSFQIEVGANM